MSPTSSSNEHVSFSRERVEVNALPLDTGYPVLYLSCRYQQGNDRPDETIVHLAAEIRSKAFLLRLCNPHTVQATHSEWLEPVLMKLAHLHSQRVRLGEPYYCYQEAMRVSRRDSYSQDQA